MKRTAAFSIALITLVAASTALVLAQRPAATFPVIVVFNDDVSFDGFAPMFRADARAAANPPRGIMSIAASRAGSRRSKPAKASWPSMSTAPRCAASRRG